MEMILTSEAKAANGNEICRRLPPQTLQFQMPDSSIAFWLQFIVIRLVTRDLSGAYVTLWLF